MISRSQTHRRRAIYYQEVQNVCENQNESRLVQCPVCGGRTKTKVFEDTVLVKYPLYCPKCKKELRVDIVKFRMVLSK